MMVLAIIALTGIVFAALIGLMMLTMRITAHQEKVERERRVADGAVVATLNHLRLDLGGSGCAGIGSTAPGLQIPFDLPASSGPVSVTCEAAADDYGDPAGEVKLVGNSYAGTITNWKTAWPWSSAPNNASAAVSPAGIDPSLIHSGPAPLRFNGHLNATAGVAALRNPVSGTPALEVRGELRQGPAGIGGTGTDCGLLATSGSPTFVSAVTGLSCGDPAKLSQAVPADYAVDPAVPALPAEAAGGCPAGPVVTFSAGRYDQNAVRTLNKWFSRACDVTYHFPTGVYWFDANDPTKPAVDRHALIINDATSRFVFGEAKGWDTGVGATAANFPFACNAGVSATQPGASIVLSGRTSLRHLAGRLAVCPYVSSINNSIPQPYPAVLQQRTEPTEVTVLPGTAVDFTPVANLVSGDAAAAAGPVEMRCKAPFGWDVRCTARKILEVKLRSANSSDALSSVRVGMLGDEINYPVTLVQSRKVNMAVTLADSSTCTTGDMDGGMDDGVETSFELLSGTCKTAITTGAQLDGATVRMTLSYVYGLPGCTLPLGCPFPPQSLVIWDVNVTASTWSGKAASTSAVNGWFNVNNALLDDSTANVVIQNVCPNPVCGGPVNELYIERSFTLDGVSLSAPLDPGDRLQSMGVVIKQLGAEAQGINSATMPGRTTLSVELSDGSVCTREFEGVVNRVGSTYYPMIDTGSSQCGAVTWAPSDQTASLLENASVTVKIRLDCLNVIAGKCGEPFTLSYLRPVAIQHVGLMATTDSYQGPVTRSRLSVDATATGPGDSVNFFGGGYMPNTALDIFWGGKPSQASLFGGELQLWSLGSQMAPGAESDVVCCTKPEVTSHKVRLTAVIDSRQILSVVAMIPADRSRPEILEWTQCGRNGDCG